MGFEPTHLAISDLKSDSLNHSDTNASIHKFFFQPQQSSEQKKRTLSKFPFIILRNENNKKKKEEIFSFFNTISIE